MNKSQTYEILSLIHRYYEHFEITQEKIDSWHILLKDSDFEEVNEQLLKHCQTSSFAPKVADLLKQDKPLDRMNAIPDVEETKKMLENMKPVELSAEAKMKIKQYQAEIRQKLGIER